MMDRSLRPEPGEYAEYYQKYVDAAGAGPPLEALAGQAESYREVLGGLSEEQAGFRYGPDKWSVREVVGHVIDAERVFTYRALRFARRDETPLPGFDQNEWERWTNADARPLDDLVDELGHVRAGTVALFRGFQAEAFVRRGVASGNAITVRALLYVTLGHGAHHLDILRERYLASPDFPR